MALIVPKYFNEYWKVYGNNLSKYYFRIYVFHFCQFWKRRAPTNDEDPSNEIFKILNMEPIFIKNHEWMFANMAPISLSKHKIAFLGILKC